MEQNLIRDSLSDTIETIQFPEALSHSSGKVRESFLLSNGNRAIVVTDRISAFDFILGTIPFKGQVLNQIAVFWFEKLNGIVPHHFLSMPDPNISIVKNAKPLPIEIIVRGYLTGTTKTSAWYAYEHLDRSICGLKMPHGMIKNQAFETPIITPTTKPEIGHDEPISREEILQRHLVDKKIWECAEAYALRLFEIGQQEARKHNLILVDTKYEMGIDCEGNLMVIDEVHTPDSSRYWIADHYEEEIQQWTKGQKSFLKPKSLDKEFVREALVQKGYDVEDPNQNPKDLLDDDIRMEASRRSIDLFERMTGHTFPFPEKKNIKRSEEIEALLQKL